MMPRALTIAGTDPRGGAGVVRDVVTFAAHGVLPAVAVTAVTVQDPGGVHGWDAIDPANVRRQIDAAVTEGIDAAKTGMLPDVATIEAVARAVADHRIDRLVVDPVLVAGTGDALAAGETTRALLDGLVPLAAVLTPNGPEATALTGIDVVDEASARAAAEALCAAGTTVACVTGGHLDGDEVLDVWAGPDGVRTVRSPRVVGADTHGTGCTLSAAITAGLAAGRSADDAIRSAIRFVGEWLARERAQTAR